jgi:hypothetical protein
MKCEYYIGNLNSNLNDLIVRLPNDDVPAAMLHSPPVK